MIIFSKRLRLTNIIIKWCKEVGVKANILSAISFLEAHDALNETYVERILSEDDKRRKE